MFEQIFRGVFEKAKAMLWGMWVDFVKFARTKPLYLVCSFAYYILASRIYGLPEGFVLAGIFYIISILIAFSPLGEPLLRVFEHVRKIETKQEKAYLLPLFEDIYMQAKQHSPGLGRIELCIIDKMTVNACALGKHTIAVTKGAIETFDSEELKAVLAHEIAHILYGDTIAKLYAVIGNGFFSFFVLTSKAIIYIAELIEYAFSKVKVSFALFIITTVKFLFNLMVVLSMSIT